jgi:uncharacterized OB-fold protein
VTAGGSGRIYSHTVVRHQTHPAFEVPYTIVLVDMDEGPRIIAQFRGSDDAAPEIGAAVHIEWETYGEQTLPVFVPDA